MFASLKGEIQTASLFARLVGRTLFPRVSGDSLLFLLCPPEALVRGAYGIREPSPELAPDEQAVRPDVVVVPGLLFTANGARLGRGAGYYDRALRALDEVPGAAPVLRVGLCFAQQLEPALPMEPHDVAMDWVATDDALYKCHPREASR